MTQHATETSMPADSEIRLMALVLARRYGPRAGEVAEHFAGEHRAIGDTARAGLWARVAARLERTTAEPTLS